MENMNRVSVIVWNPVYIEEVELDEDGVNPANLIPLVSGNTIPDSEDKDAAEDVIEDKDEDEKMEDVPQILQDVVKDLEELNWEWGASCPLLLGTLAPISPLLSPLLRYGTQGRLGSENIDCILTNRKEVSDRLSNQVWDLLWIMQERVDQQTCHSKDIKLIDGWKLYQSYTD